MPSRSPTRARDPRDSPDSARTHDAAARVIEPLYAEILRRNQGEQEFHLAVREVLETLGPVLTRAAQKRKKGAQAAE